MIASEHVRMKSREFRPRAMNAFENRNTKLCPKSAIATARSGQARSGAEYSEAIGSASTASRTAIARVRTSLSLVAEANTSATAGSSPRRSAMNRAAAGEMPKSAGRTINPANPSASAKIP